MMMLSKTASSCSRRMASNDVARSFIGSSRRLGDCTVASPLACQSRLLSTQSCLENAPAIASISSSSNCSSSLHFNNSAAALAVSVIGATIFSAASTSNQQNVITEAEASVISSPNNNNSNKGLPDMRGLSKALAQREERQKVVLGRLLKELHELAEEVVAQEHAVQVERKKTLQLQRQATEAMKEKNGLDWVNLTDIGDLTTQLTPARAWEILHSLKEGRAVLRRNDVKRIARAAARVIEQEPSLIDLRGRKDLKQVTVVGDLHGHFNSMFKVLNLLGDTTHTPWNGQAAVVFNGDFVDRGDNSLDVMMSLLLLKLAYPEHIYLNRGNHEDSVLSTVYGYLEELEGRYKGSVDDIWDTFVEVFSALPLCVRTETAAIMHGGIPADGFRLEEIAAITPAERRQQKSVLEPAESDTVGKLMQNLSWSDPSPEEGIEPNEDRGAGMFFGPDVAKRFLKDNNVKYLIRSHEPVDEGYEALPCEEGRSTVTVFSASSYPNGEGYNCGAIIRLAMHPNNASSEDAVPDMEAVPYRGEQATNESEEEFNQRTFRAVASLVSENRHSLEAEFEYMAKKNMRRLKLKRHFWGFHDKNFEKCPTLISPEQWADAMAYVLGLPQLDWLSFQPTMAPTMMSSSSADNAQESSSNESSILVTTSSMANVLATSKHVTQSQQLRIKDSGLIDYKIFLEMHCNPISGSDQLKHLDPKTLDVLMKNHSMLLTVFKFLDRDQNGCIDREEFRLGMKLLREKRNLKQQNNADGPGASSGLAAMADDPDAIFDAIDLDGSGTIELEEFEKSFQSIEMPTDLAIFKIFDADRNGSIDRQEFIQGCQMLNKRLPPKEKIEDANGLFDKIDSNGDGNIDLEEMRQVLKDFFPSLS